MGCCMDVKCSDCEHCKPLKDGVCQCKETEEFFHESEADTLIDCNFFEKKIDRICAN